MRPEKTLSVPVLLITVMLLSSCTDLLFQPLKEHFYTPDVVNVKYEDVYVTSAPGITLHGWKLLTEQPKKGNILFLHGNGENISTHFANIYWLVDDGYDVYIFDYRGYGQSTGWPELDGIIVDTSAMLDYVITQSAADEQVIVIGHSIGGSLAIYTVATSPNKSRIDALITIEAFSDYRDITRDVLSTSWLTWLLQWPLSFTIDNSYSPIDVVADISPVPYLVMHSRYDLMIDFYHAEALYEAAKQPKQLIEIESDHNHIFNDPNNRKLLIQYLGSIGVTEEH